VNFGEGKTGEIPAFLKDILTIIVPLQRFFVKQKNGFVETLIRLCKYWFVGDKFPSEFEGVS
jgi:hypothetical protein